MPFMLSITLPFAYPTSKTSPSPHFPSETDQQVGNFLDIAFGKTNTRNYYQVGFCTFSYSFLNRIRPEESS